MPNWCNNTLEITHSDLAMIERVRTAFKEGRLLDEFVPVPKELHIVAGRVGDDTDPKQIELETQEKSNLEKFGYSTWYDFCVNEWGTKWDVGGDDCNPAQDIPNGLIMSFDSAWAPPCMAYEKMLDLGFSIRATYYEPGMAFCGVWEDGCDDFYEIGSMTADEVEDLLPSFLDESYGISECIREYEEENKEDEELYTWVKEGAKGE
jgi:hypothetical protein